MTRSCYGCLWVWWSGGWARGLITYKTKGIQRCHTALTCRGTTWPSEIGFSAWFRRRRLPRPLCRTVCRWCCPPRCWRHNLSFSCPLRVCGRWAVFRWSRPWRGCGCSGWIYCNKLVRDRVERLASGCFWPAWNGSATSRDNGRDDVESAKSWPCSSPNRGGGGVRQPRPWSPGQCWPPSSVRPRSSYNIRWERTASCRNLQTDQIKVPPSTATAACQPIVGSCGYTWYYHY